MDIMMPLMNGVEATRILVHKMKVGEIPKTPIIALSAGQLSSDEENLYFHEVGFTAYLSKPTSKEEFFNILQKYNVY